MRPRHAILLGTAALVAVLFVGLPITLLGPVPVISEAHAAPSPLGRMRRALEDAKYDKVVEIGGKYLEKNPGAEEETEIREVMSLAAFALAKTVDTIDAWQLFRQEYPQSSKSAAAMRAEAWRFFSDRLDQDDEEALLDFLETYPGSGQEQIVRSMADQLGWTRTVSENTPESYQAYRERYSQGVGHAESFEREYAVVFERVKGVGTAERWRRLLADYPQHPQRSVASRALWLLDPVAEFGPDAVPLRPYTQEVLMGATDLPFAAGQEMTISAPEGAGLFSAPETVKAYVLVSPAEGGRVSALVPLERLVEMRLKALGLDGIVDPATVSQVEVETTDDRISVRFPFPLCGWSHPSLEPDRVGGFAVSLSSDDAGGTEEAFLPFFVEGSWKESASPGLAYLKGGDLVRLNPDTGVEEALLADAGCQYLFRAVGGGLEARCAAGTYHFRKDGTIWLQPEDEPKGSPGNVRMRLAPKESRATPVQRIKSIGTVYWDGEDIKLMAEDGSGSTTLLAPGSAQPHYAVDGAGGWVVADWGDKLVQRNFRHLDKEVGSLKTAYRTQAVFTVPGTNSLRHFDYGFADVEMGALIVLTGSDDFISVHRRRHMHDNGKLNHLVTFSTRDLPGSNRIRWVRPHFPRSGSCLLLEAGMHHRSLSHKNTWTVDLATGERGGYGIGGMASCLTGRPEPEGTPQLKDAAGPKNKEVFAEIDGEWRQVTDTSAFEPRPWCEGEGGREGVVDAIWYGWLPSGKLLVQAVRRGCGKRREGLAYVVDLSEMTQIELGPTGEDIPIWMLANWSYDGRFLHIPALDGEPMKLLMPAGSTRELGGIRDAHWLTPRPHELFERAE